MSDIVNQKVDDISKKMNSLYEKIDTLSTKMQTEMDDMNIPQLYKYAMEAFDLAGKLKTSSDIANSLQSMLTTVWEDVP
jgi:predicted transcriptional regulator